MKKVARHNTRWQISMLLISAITFTSIRYASSSLIKLRFDPPMHMESIVLWILFFVFFVIPVIKKISVTKDTLLLTCILAFCWCYSLLLNFDYCRDWLLMFYKIFIRCLPYYLIARNIKDYYLLDQMLEKGSYIITLSTLIIISVKLLTGTMARYDMSLAYLTLPSSIISVVSLRNKFSSRAFTNLLISSSLIIFLGTRGPLVCLVACVLYCLMEKFLHKSPKAIILTTVLVLGSIFVIIYFQSILEIITSVAKRLGMSVRIFQTLQSGTFFSSSGRNKIYKSSFAVLCQNPIIGTGIIADRLQIAPLYEGTTDNFLGTYPHLILLEFILQFGIFVGGILCLIFSYAIIRSMINPLNKAFHNVYLSFLFIGFVPLFLSGSYLNTETFYIFLGLTVNNFVAKNYMRNSIQEVKNEDVRKRCKDALHK